MLKKRNDGDLPAPLEGLAEERVTRARAIKLAGAMVGTGAFAFLLPDEADAANRRRRRRRRRRRQRQAAAERRRRQNNVTSEQSTVNFGNVSVAPGTTVPAGVVRVTNNGSTPVTIDPQVVGDGFSLGNLSGLDLQLDPNGGFVDIPVVVDARNALSDGVKTGELRILDDSDRLLLETVGLVADVNVL